MPDQPGLTYEQSLWQQGKTWIAGVDEVGLGCLAGPIVAAAIIIPQNCHPIPGVRDSKQMSAKQRESAFETVLQQAVRFGFGLATIAEIDQINILQASYLAMNRALARVQPVDNALIDGRAIKPGKITGEYTTIVKGDAHSYAIACASVIAKVRRDRLMRRLAQKYPGYGWEKNAGYGTKQHREALLRLGITPWHRQSYAPVKQVMEQLSLFYELGGI
ncbi:ribonuclease HII [filamentous cyanobacterium LEGE 11480]|uniref:Ribonuclease HII n=1 Tax=Romeriopsis navalis LEGE 11480 TaxID=2777977 RepID=A0A928VJA3_9CYAN|nr:ribonuclease HII [Romeriopsis navalis]MBE9029370.1 ribonuclease HII [Romeriopsis navalis LEGE 11480]